MHVCIAGTRGIPARHGGFETFAQDLALYLAKRKHKVTVFCQAPNGTQRSVTLWQEVELIHIPSGDGPMGTILFDLRCVLQASRMDATILTLGYNTAIFSVFYRLHRRVHLMNMDGIEWKRDKWNWVQRLWLRLNEYLGAKLADHLIADHPVIKLHHLSHAASEKITVIPYGAPSVDSSDREVLDRFGLTPDGYALVVARPEPENSVLEIVSAFSQQRRSIKLVVLGHYDTKAAYQRSVLDAGSDEVIFPGAIYEKRIVEALRTFALFYLHGHRVGGTNPSLVESLAANNAIVAHDNPFTRWVAGKGARYFTSRDSLETILNELLTEPKSIIAMQDATAVRFREAFQLEAVLYRYECLLQEMTDRGMTIRAARPSFAD